MQSNTQRPAVARTNDVKMSMALLEYDILGTNIGILIGAVGHDGPTDPAKDFVDSWIVAANYGEAVKRQVMQELNESRA